ncbi:hypothetical protein, partial [Ralstonia pseudosolanacearum]|uniref:hypothetical protein n=1 Tax=Ralstonia pseudosolanacearum TaxID=1310165 RepID=UPI003D176410
MTKSTKEDHTWVDGKCSLCGCYKPLTTNGAYDVTAAAGVPVYSVNREDSSKLVTTVPQGTTITVTEIARTSTDYYWGRVTKIGTASQSSNVYVCMKSSLMQAHSHSYSYTYSVAGHKQHTKTGTCKCGATTSTKENHIWVNGKCSLCSCSEPYTTEGGYIVTAANGVNIYNESNSGGSYTTEAKGTYLYVSKVELTDSNYYWGNVTQIGTKAVNKWVCMKSSELGPHTHTFAEPVYETKNNLVHYVDTKCTVCNYKKRSEEDHNFVNGICTKCSGWEPYKTAGAYIVVNESGIMPYSIRLQESGKEVEPLLPKGTYVEVTDVYENDAGNYWGKVTWIGNEKVTKT